MKNTIYWTNFTVVTIALFYNLVISVLDIIGSKLGYMDIIQLFHGIMLTYFIVMSLLFILLLCLSIRRIYLKLKLKKGVPVSFRGWKVYITGIGVSLIFLGLISLLLSVLMKAGSGVPAGMIIGASFPFICISFLINEISSIRNKE